MSSDWMVVSCAHYRALQSRILELEDKLVSKSSVTEFSELFVPSVSIPRGPIDHEDFLP